MTVLKQAVVSADALYRYELRRAWDQVHPTLCWVMLNPSTADAEIDDPTIRRVMSFSRSWGYGGVVVVNLFGLRATDPRVLARHPDPVGPGNDEPLLFWTRNLDAVAAWGAHRMAERRGRWLRDELNGKPLLSLGETRGGAPKHPLYVRRDVQATPWPSKGDSGRA